RIRCPAIDPLKVQAVVVEPVPAVGHPLEVRRAVFGQDLHGAFEEVRLEVVRTEEETELAGDLAPRPRGCQLAPGLHGLRDALLEMLLVADEPRVLPHGLLVISLRPLEQRLDALLLVGGTVAEIPPRLARDAREPREGGAERVLRHRLARLLLE